MLLSYMVLPAQKTRSHYLSICLIVSVMMIAIGFVIPLGANPDQCYNEITPNDMYSSTTCAWSGAFIVAGGLSADMWIFIRALSMNLQICWDIVPGRKFFYISQALGWGIPAVLFTATMTVTGVSFRFAKQCDVNHENSMRDFWGPLMAFAGAAGLLQLMTFGYCIRVYLKNLFTDQSPSSSASGSGLPSYSGSVRTQTARAVWRRLQKVLWLQWRGICIVTIILVDVIFFSIVFVWLDGLQSKVSKDFTQVEPWLFCLAAHPTDPDACLDYVGNWLVNQPTVVAVLILLSLAGLQVFLFLARPSVFPAWIDFFQSKFTHRQEFVSLDARRDIMRSNSKQDLINYKRGHESTTFEMQKPGATNSLSLDLESKGGLSPSETLISSPSEAYRSPLQINRDSPSGDTDIRNSASSSLIGRGRIPPEYIGRLTPDMVPGSPPTPVVRYDAISLHRQNSDYFNRQRLGSSHTQRATSSHSQRSERGYKPPTSSFSAPHAPSRNSSVRSISFDPRDTYSRGGLALNPPSEAGESQEDLTQQHNSLDRR